MDCDVYPETPWTGKVKGKVVPVHNKLKIKHHDMKTYGGVEV
jgi:hypothetical protein